MKCYAEQQNLIRSTEGNSGLRPFCIATSVGFFIGDKMKICTKCHQKKKLAEFYKRTKLNNDYRPQCIMCHLKYDKEYRQTEQGKKAHRKGWIRHSKTKKRKLYVKHFRQSERYKTSRSATNKCYNIRHPEHKKSWTATNNAVTAGKLPHPNSLKCSYCPKQAKEYHHHKGYEPEHWLDVIPACIKCHKKIHLKKAV